MGKAEQIFGRGQVRLKSRNVVGSGHLRVHQNGEIDGKGGEGAFATFRVHHKPGDIISLQHSGGKFLRIVNGNLDSQGAGGKFCLFKVIQHGNPEVVSLESVVFAGQHIGIKDNGKVKPPNKTGTGKASRFKVKKVAGGGGIQIGGGARMMEAKQNMMQHRQMQMQQQQMQQQQMQQQQAMMMQQQQAMMMQQQMGMAPGMMGTPMMGTPIMGTPMMTQQQMMAQQQAQANALAQQQAQARALAQQQAQAQALAQQQAQAQALAQQQAQAQALAQQQAQAQALAQQQAQQQAQAQALAQQQAQQQAQAQALAEQQAAASAQAQEQASEAKAEEKDKAPDISKPGRLKLTAFRGEGLKNRQRFGKQDPYLTMKIGNQTQKTQVHKKGGTEPSWEETFTYELDGKYTSLELGCFDYESIGSPNEIGSGIIPIADILAGEGKEVPCQIRGPKKGNRAGMIIMSAVYEEFVAGNLFLTLNDAKGLPNKESIGKQDPYAKILVDGKREKKSKVHKNGGSNPVWNQEFTYSLAGKEQLLDIKLYDSDTGRDDKIGECRVNISDLKSQSGATYYNVTDGGKKAGQVSLSCRFVPKE